MMTEIIESLRSDLRAMGASVVSDVADGAFLEVMYCLDDLRIQLLSDYGAWRANLSYLGGPWSPSSFWTAALGGDTVPPEPAVTSEDLVRLSERLPELIMNAADLSGKVARMAELYRRHMGETLS